MNTQTKKQISLAVITGLIIFLSGAVLAQENKEKNIKVENKETTGVISSLSANFIAVETGVDSQSGAATESAFNLDKKVKIVHKKSLKEIKVGDTVTVGYEETIETRDDGRKMRKTKVQTITFLKSTPKEMTAQEENISPRGGESQKESLPLKGLKER